MTHKLDDEEVSGEGSLTKYVVLYSTLLGFCSRSGHFVRPDQHVSAGRNASDLQGLRNTLLAVFIVLPLTVFAYELRSCRPLSSAMFLIFPLSILHAWLSSPFSVAALSRASLECNKTEKVRSGLLTHE